MTTIRQNLPSLATIRLTHRIIRADGPARWECGKITFQSKIWPISIGFTRYSSTPCRLLPNSSRCIHQVRPPTTVLRTKALVEGRHLQGNCGSTGSARTDWIICISNWNYLRLALFPQAHFLIATEMVWNNRCPPWARYAGQFCLSPRRLQHDRRYRRLHNAQL